MTTDGGGAMTWDRSPGAEPVLSHRPRGPSRPSGDLGPVPRRRTGPQSPPPGRTRAIGIAVALAALLLAATGCSDPDGPDTATDPGGSDTPTPTAIPDPVIVMDVARPELCTGPIAESYPPQCGGPVISNWNWADHKGEYDQVGDVRWGEFMVEGHYDGDEFVVTSAVAVEHTYR